MLVVGPGVLGSLAGKLWLESFPEATVTGQTNTVASHERCPWGAYAQDNESFTVRANGTKRHETSLTNL